MEVLFLEPNNTTCFMKKLFCLIAVFIGACFVFSSCEKSGTGDGGSLVGSWICEEHVVEMSNGKSYRYTNKNEWDNNNNEILMDYTMTFSKDGVLTADAGVPGSYSVNGSVISCMGIPMYTFSINGKKLVLEFTDAFLAQINAVHSLAHDLSYVKVVGYYKKR